MRPFDLLRIRDRSCARYLGSVFSGSGRRSPGPSTHAVRAWTTTQRTSAPGPGDHRYHPPNITTGELPWETAYIAGHPGPLRERK
jgi:hypothetical protein